MSNIQNEMYLFYWFMFGKRCKIVNATQVAWTFAEEYYTLYKIEMLNDDYTFHDAVYIKAVKEPSLSLLQCISNKTYEE